MERNKEELLEVIEKQKKQLQKYETLIRDLRLAHEGLVKEKTALDDSLKVLTSEMKEEAEETDAVTEEERSRMTSSGLKKKTRNAETVDQLKTQLGVLMNSLATLSSEKSRMEANFQADKKQIRSEREEYEKVIRDLREKLKQTQKHGHSEVEHMKYKLIMERHEREKEQADHSAMIKELQRLVNDERREKEALEAQVKELKSQVSTKSQNRILEAELEVARNKLKQAEATAKEAPPLLLSLQAEMASMRRQHRNAIHEEQKRAATAEQRARALAMTHERRVAGLEARLAELSETVGGYDRLRQQDQQAIQRLKEQLVDLREAERKDRADADIDDDPKEIVAKIKKFYTRLLDLDNKREDSPNLRALLSSLNLRDANEDLEYQKKCELLLQELEDYKRRMSARSSVISPNKQQQQSNAATSEMNEDNDEKAKLHLAKMHNKNLEERIRVLNSEMAAKETNFETRLEQQQQLLREEREKSERALSQKDHEYRGKIAALEQQLLRQRERSLTIIEEKDQEISTLKASFQALLPNKGSSASSESKSKSSRLESKPEAAKDLVTGLLAVDGTPILHYSQELARKEVQTSALRKSNLKLEAILREKQRELIRVTEKHEEDAKVLRAQITRLEACQSREGANLEYLKNVFLNFLTSNDMSGKRHMLNAISTVLRFTADEMGRIRHVK